jgi:D-alanyl-D-alanine carboxypeptidase (penicillin-binding protein 5/6)
VKARSVVAAFVAVAAAIYATVSVLPAPFPSVQSADWSRPAPPPLSGVAAPAFAISYDGRIIAGRKANDLRPTASTIKILTALALLQEGLPLSRRIVVTAEDAAAAHEGLRLGHGELPLVTGETLTVRDLLLAMLLPSADNAADILAALSPGGASGLLGRMQSVGAALRLGLPALGDPSGLSSLDQLSPEAEIRLGEAALRNPTLAAIVRLRTATLSQGQQIRSLNRLLWSYGGAIGIKTGQTVPAGYVLLFAAQRGKDVAVGVVMGEQSDAVRFEDARRLLDWAFARARAETLPAGQVAGRLIWPGGTSQVLRTAGPLFLPQGGKPALNLSPAAAVARGGTVGYLSIGARRVALEAPPVPTWIRLWSLVASWSGRLSGTDLQRP